MSPKSGLPEPAPDWALFLDIDGTIVDLAPTPGSVEIPEHVLNSLIRLETALDGAFALISGRNLADIDILTSPHRFSAAGQHGAEWRIDAQSVVYESDHSKGVLAPVRARFEAFAVENEGILVEDKGATLAIHYRLAPGLKHAVGDLAAKLAAQLPHHSIFQGKAVVEIRPDGVDKGRCIDRFLAARPFADRVPVYAGDDRTDEDAFAVVNRRGGISIRVGPPPDSIETTRAHWQCADVTEFTNWLAKLPEHVDASD